MLTLCIVTGAIWATMRSHIWDPRRSLITWFIYAYLHARLMYGGRKERLDGYTRFAAVPYLLV